MTKGISMAEYQAELLKRQQMEQAARDVVKSHHEQAEAKRQKRREQEAGKRSGILDEHAEFLTALLTIDELLDKMLAAWGTDVQDIYQRMRAAIPESIKETRKS